MKGIRKARRLSRDINEAVNFYEAQSASLAMDFLSAFGKAVRRLTEFPSIGSPRYRHLLDMPGLRCIPTDTFPYLLFYKEQGEHLFLARLLHHSRDIAGLLKQR